MTNRISSAVQLRPLRVVLGVALSVLLAGCQAISWLSTLGLGGGFVGPDLLAGNPVATPIALSIQQSEAGLNVAIDPTGKRIAYAAPDGVYVSDIGGPIHRLVQAAGFGWICWTPDAQSLIVTMNGTSPSCTVDSQGGKTCSSRTSDPGLGSLERIDVSTGNVQTIADHVSGLGNLTLAPNGRFLAFTGELEEQTTTPLTPPGIHLLDLGSSKLQTEASGNYTQNLAWAPDSEHLAFLNQNLTSSGGTSACVLSVSDNQVSQLGQSDFNNPIGPLWQADSAAYCLLNRGHETPVPMETYALDGSPKETSSIALADSQAPVTSFNGAVQSPDGRYTLGFGLSIGGAPQAVFHLDLAAKRAVSLLPDGHFLQWIGSGPDFLCSVGQTWLQHYYIVKPKEQGI